MHCTGLHTFSCLPAEKGHEAPDHHMLPLEAAACRCLDLSRDRSRIALVDEHSCLHVYEAETGLALWSAEGAASAAWNARLPGMLAWSDAEALYTRMGTIPAQRHALIIQVGNRFPCLMPDILPAVVARQDLSLCILPLPAVGITGPLVSRRGSNTDKTRAGKKEN